MLSIVQAIEAEPAFIALQAKPRRDIREAQDDRGDTADEVGRRRHGRLADVIRLALACRIEGSFIREEGSTWEHHRCLPEHHILSIVSEVLAEVRRGCGRPLLIEVTRGIAVCSSRAIARRLLDARAQKSQRTEWCRIARDTRHQIVRRSTPPCDTRGELGFTIDEDACESWLQSHLQLRRRRSEGGGRHRDRPLLIELGDGKLRARSSREAIYEQGHVARDGTQRTADSDLLQQRAGGIRHDDELISPLGERKIDVLQLVCRGNLHFTKLGGELSRLRIEGKVKRGDLEHRILFVESAQGNAPWCTYREVQGRRTFFRLRLRQRQAIISGTTASEKQKGEGQGKGTPYGRTKG